MHSVIRVLLVDDDPSCREGLRQLLSLTDDLSVVGEAGSAEDACRVGRQLRPDVVVIDADLPRSSCLDAIRNLGTREGCLSPTPAFVCLAVYPDQHDAAITAGANRFMRKDGSPRELMEAIRAAAADLKAHGTDSSSLAC
jgi:DNA-binding NarL/FixJ family response regulator